MTDAFQAAAQAAAQSTSPAPSGGSPFGSPKDMANPFKKSSDFGGGDFTPLPSMEFLFARTLIYIPRQKVTVDDIKNPGEKKEIWCADLYVIDGGELKFPYEIKADPEKGRPQAEWKEWVHENCAPETPFFVPKAYVFQPSFNWMLNKLTDDGGRLALGSPKRVPTNVQKKQGLNTAQVEQQYQEWVKRGRVKPEATYAWSFADPTPEGEQAAAKWWELNKETLKF
jgi:hypothetical protein